MCVNNRLEGHYSLKDHTELHTLFSRKKNCPTEVGIRLYAKIKWPEDCCAKRYGECF